MTSKTKKTDWFSKIIKPINNVDSLCGQISLNNVLCYYWNRGPLVKLKLLRCYCSDFNGSACAVVVDPFGY